MQSEIVKSIVRQRLVLLAFLVLLAGSSAYGSDWSEATLTICNKGSAGSINVVLGFEDDMRGLVISGWADIAQGHCRLVYSQAGTQSNGAMAAYIGIGFFDSQHHVTSGRVEPVPDFGQFPFGTKVLTKADKRLCIASECVSAALHFYPIPARCSTQSYHEFCVGGDYYLDVKPSASDTNLHASAGSESGKDAAPAEPSLGDSIMKELGKELGKAAAEKHHKQEQAVAAARRNAPICVPASLVENHSWNNPPAGGKMEAFKIAITKVLRDKSRNLDDEPVQWMVIGERFDTFNPATTDPRSLVEARERGGRCFAGMYNYTLPIN